MCATSSSVPPRVTSPHPPDGFSAYPSYSCPLLTWQLDCQEFGGLEAQGLGADGQWHLEQGEAAALHTGWQHHFMFSGN